MKVLVTGGTGFVGRYLARELMSREFACRFLIRSKDKAANLADCDSAEFHVGDLTLPETLKGIADGIDHVYHLAAEGHISAMSDEATRKFFSTNVRGTTNLMRECGVSRVKKFVHFSSTAAMGLIRKKLADESDTPQPVTPYQKSKLESEKVALQLGKEVGVPTVVVRPCMIYGPGGRGEFYKMCRLMHRGLFPRVGRGRNLTPLVHVNDVVQGAIKAADKGRPGEVYLLASERSIELTEMRNIVMEAWGARARYLYVPSWFMFSVAWFFEIIGKLTGTPPVATRQNIASTIWDREFSIEKARRELLYEPAIGFREGIIETVDWFKTLD